MQLGLKINSCLDRLCVFIPTQNLVWSILVGHAAYSWGVLCHHPELHTVCSVFVVQG
jgi:hypothetical protein